jgi:uncharacterized protein (TIRG00374 family)
VDRINRWGFVGGAALLFLLWWRFGHGDVLTTFRQVSWPILVFHLVAGCAVTLGYAVRWRWVCGALGQCIPLARLTGTRLAGDAIGSLVPSAKLAGEPVRVGLLYASGVRGTAAAAGVTIDRIMEMIANTVCAIAYVGVFWATPAARASRGAASLLLLALVVLLASLALLLRLLRRGGRPLAPLYRWRRITEGSRLTGWLEVARRTEDHVSVFFRDHPGIFLRGLATSLAIEALIVCEYWLLLRAFGITLDVPTLLLVLVAVGFSRAAPTPAGLGALEAGQVGVLALAHGQPEAGFVVGVVIRAHETFWAAMGLAVLTQRGWAWARRPAALPEKA